MITLTIVNVDTSYKEAVVVTVVNSFTNLLETLSFSSGSTVKEITQAIQDKCDALNASSDLVSLVGMEFTSNADSISVSKGVLDAK